MPLTTAALLVGSFTLAGLPLTASFFPRWLLFQDLAQADPRWVWLLATGGLGVAIGYLRGLKVMLTPAVSPGWADRFHVSWLTTILLAALGLLSLGLGFFPDPLLMAAERLLMAYPLPSL
jgi:formate hydrogenlyase subunit 3/multisubunit Na+/H+ antiporter MnhD subunit